MEYTLLKPIFGGVLNASQTTNIEHIESAWRTYGDGDDRKLAYCCAIALNEVGSKLHPVVENMNYTAKRITQVWPSRFRSIRDAEPYANNPRILANKVYAGRMGNDPETNDGWIYRGRGFAQITGKDLYARLGKLLSIDLVGNPDLALDPKVGAWMLVNGMMLGLFTGRRLSQYFNDITADPINARAIVNGDVKRVGAYVAGLYSVFLAAIRNDVDTAHVPLPTPTRPALPSPSVPDNVVEPWWTQIVHWFLGLFRKGD